MRQAGIGLVVLAVLGLAAAADNGWYDDDEYATNGEYTNGEDDWTDGGEYEYGNGEDYWFDDEDLYDGIYDYEDYYNGIYDEGYDDWNGEGVTDYDDTISGYSDEDWWSGDGDRAWYENRYNYYTDDWYEEDDAFSDWFDDWL